MIYELRIYDDVPGKPPALNDRFTNVTLGYFEKYGLNVVGFWTDDVGVSNRSTYILAIGDMAQRDKAWATFCADDGRVKAFADSKRDGPLDAGIQSTIIRPIAYSPLW